MRMEVFGAGNYGYQKWYYLKVLSCSALSFYWRWGPLLILFRVCGRREGGGERGWEAGDEGCVRSEGGDVVEGCVCGGGNAFDEARC